jgi:hypothetical protein
VATRLAASFGLVLTVSVITALLSLSMLSSIQDNVIDCSGQQRQG